MIFEAGDRIYIKDSLENLQHYQELLDLSLFEDEQSEHIDPENDHAKIQTIIIASKFGLDFNSGGLYARKKITGKKIPSLLEIRGEIYIGKEDFKSIKGNFANPRNAAGGSC